jgi:hypothetical protein
MAAAPFSASSEPCGLQCSWVSIAQPSTMNATIPTIATDVFAQTVAATDFEGRRYALNATIAIPTLP